MKQLEKIKSRLPQGIDVRSSSKNDSFIGMGKYASSPASRIEAIFNASFG